MRMPSLVDQQVAILTLQNLMLIGQVELSTLIQMILWYFIQMLSPQCILVRQEQQLEMEEMPTKVNLLLVHSQQHITFLVVTIGATQELTQVGI